MEGELSVVVADVVGVVGGLVDGVTVVGLKDVTGVGDVFGGFEVVETGGDGVGDKTETQSPSWQTYP